MISIWAFSADFRDQITKQTDDLIDTQVTFEVRKFVSEFIWNRTNGYISIPWRAYNQILALRH